jgi:hypothetical protein
MSRDPWADLRGALLAACNGDADCAELAVSRIAEHVKTYEAMFKYDKAAAKAGRIKTDAEAKAELEKAAFHASALSDALRSLSQEGYYWYHQACRPLTEGQTGEEIEILKDEISLHVFLAKSALVNAAELLPIRKHRPPNLNAEFLVWQSGREWFLATGRWPVLTMVDGEMVSPLYVALNGIISGLVTQKHFRAGIRKAKKFAEDPSDPAHGREMELKGKRSAKS